MSVNSFYDFLQAFIKARSWVMGSLSKDWIAKKINVVLNPNHNACGTTFDRIWLNRRPVTYYIHPNHKLRVLFHSCSYVSCHVSTFKDNSRRVSEMSYMSWERLIPLVHLGSMYEEMMAWDKPEINRLGVDNSDNEECDISVLKRDLNKNKQPTLFLLFVKVLFLWYPANMFLPLTYPLRSDLVYGGW